MAGILLQCGGVLGPSAPRVVFGVEQYWESGWLNRRGSTTEATSNVRSTLASSLGAR